MNNIKRNTDREEEKKWRQILIFVAVGEKERDRENK